jgi:hypothetical protein
VVTRDEVVVLWLMDGNGRMNRGSEADNNIGGRE